MKIAIAWLLVLIVVSMIVLPHSFVNAKSKDSKAKNSIIKAIGKSVEGKYSTIKLIQLSKSNVSGYVIVYNTTKANPVPVPPPNPPPNPPPVPTGETTKVCLVGDFKDSSVFDAMKKNGCNYRIALGDNGYASDLSLLKKIAPDRAVCGNHDTKEDGDATIEKECLVYTGDHWSQAIANGTTLIIGLNTNGDQNTQVNFVKSLPLTKYKNVIVVTHKNGHVFPNAHHPAEAKTLYAELEKLVPNLYEISGHNHNEASAANGHWFISGAGGKSHYSCGTSVEWNFCDNSHYGYLQVTIDNKIGTLTAKFIN